MLNFGYNLYMNEIGSEIDETSDLTIFTIGHSNLLISDFINLLTENEIQMVMDVRSVPYSKYASQFNKEDLSRSLREARIDYFFSGKELGGRPEDPTCYKNQEIPVGKVDYLREVNYPVVMTKPFFQHGIERIRALAKEYRIAIMCSEEDPAQCHRHHLIGRYLVENGVSVKHIRSDGKLVGDKQLTNIVEEPTGIQLDLF